MWLEICFTHTEKGLPTRYSEDVYLVRCVKKGRLNLFVLKALLVTASIGLL